MRKTLAYHVPGHVLGLQPMLMSLRTPGLADPAAHGPAAGSPPLPSSMAYGPNPQANASIAERRGSQPFVLSTPDLSVLIHVNLIQGYLWDVNFNPVYHPKPVNLFQDQTYAASSPYLPPHMLVAVLQLLQPQVQLVEGGSYLFHVGFDDLA